MYHQDYQIDYMSQVNSQSMLYYSIYWNRERERDAFFSKARVQIAFFTHYLENLLNSRLYERECYLRSGGD